MSRERWIINQRAVEGENGRSLWIRVEAVFDVWCQSHLMEFLLRRKMLFDWVQACARVYGILLLPSRSRTNFKRFMSFDPIGSLVYDLIPLSKLQISTFNHSSLQPDIIKLILMLVFVLQAPASGQMIHKCSARERKYTAKATNHAESFWWSDDCEALARCLCGFMLTKHKFKPEQFAAEAETKRSQPAPAASWASGTPRALLYLREERMIKLWKCK